MTDFCIECGAEAQWIRSTQFAGDHPYCEQHANVESDFQESNSYKYWYKVNIPDVTLSKEQ